MNGEQLTIHFHVDDAKASHKDPAVLENLMRELCGVFGKEEELIETRGKIHDYLGLQIDYSLRGNVVLSMFEYLEDIITEAPADLKPSNCKYPCNGNYFELTKLHQNQIRQPQSFPSLCEALTFHCKMIETQNTIERYFPLFMDEEPYKRGLQKAGARDWICAKNNSPSACFRIRW